MIAIGLALGLAGSYFVVRRIRVESLSASCREAIQSNDWDRLERCAEQWCWWDRGQATPQLYLAEAALQTEQYERAVELLDRLPDADLRTPAALSKRSSVLFERLNRPIEGAETLERAIRLDPKLVEARRRLIFFYAFTLQRRRIRFHAYEAIRHDAELPETYVYLMGSGWLSFGNAYELNGHWLRGNPDEELFLVAGALHRIWTKAALEDETPGLQKGGGQDPDSVSHQRKLVAEYLQQFPQNLELLAYFLEQKSASGDAEGVADLLSRAPAEAAEDNRFWRYQGWLHAARGELAEAEKSYRQALSLNCYDYLTRFQLAGVLRRLRRLDEVKALEEQWREGRELRRAVLQSPSVDKVPMAIMRRIARHARSCGDDLAAGKLERRFLQWAGNQAKR